MLLWVIIVIITLSLLRLSTWQSRIGISAIAISRVAFGAAGLSVCNTQGRRERLPSISPP